MNNKRLFLILCSVVVAVNLSAAKEAKKTGLQTNQQIQEAETQNTDTISFLATCIPRKEIVNPQSTA